MRPIPPSLMKELASDPFMKKCVWSGSLENVSWEHCWIYQGRQINERWAIVPLRRDLNVNMQANVKAYCRWVSLSRATPEDLAKYPRHNWAQEKRYLNSIINKIKPNSIL